MSVLENMPRVRHDDPELLLQTDGETKQRSDKSSNKDNNKNILKLCTSVNFVSPLILKKFKKNLMTKAIYTIPNSPNSPTKPKWMKIFAQYVIVNYFKMSHTQYVYV